MSTDEPDSRTGNPIVSTEVRVAQWPTPSFTPAWVGAIDQDMALTTAGLPGDEEVWVTSDAAEMHLSSQVNGVPVLVSLIEAEEHNPMAALQAQFEADFEKVYSHSFQVEASHVSFGPPDGALRAPFLFRLAYKPEDTFDRRDIDRLARDNALTAVTSGAYAWLLELWRWAGVVGARRTPSRRQNYYRYLADLICVGGESYQVMPYPHRTTINESQFILSRHATPLTPQTLAEVVSLVEAGRPAPAAPLLVMDAVEVADRGDLRSAMVLAGTALDLVLDEVWEAARSADPSLPELAGTLGKKAHIFNDNSISLPLGLSRSALQTDVIDVRNAAAHGDTLDTDAVWNALGFMDGIARERWPEGPPSQW